MSNEYEFVGAQDEYEIVPQAAPSQAPQQQGQQNLNGSLPLGSAQPKQEISSDYEAVGSLPFAYIKGAAAGAAKGFEEIGGLDDVGFGEATKEWFRTVGVFNRADDDIRGAGAIKSFNETVMTGAAAGIDLGMRALYAGLIGVFTGIEQTFREMGMSKGGSRRAVRDLLAIMDGNIPQMTGGGGSQLVKARGRTGEAAKVEAEIQRLRGGVVDDVAEQPPISRETLRETIADVLEEIPEESRAAAGEAILDDLEAAMPAALDRDALLVSMQKKIGTPTVGQINEEAIYSRTDEVIRHTLDRLRPLKMLEEGEFGEIAEGLRPYREFRLLARMKGTLEAVQKHGTVMWTDRGLEFSGDSLNSVFRDVAGDMDNAMLYFAARRADNLRQRGIVSGFTDAEVDTALTLGQRNPKFIEAFDKYQEFDRRKMAFAVQSGLVSPESAVAMLGKDHVPFYRVIDDTGALDRHAIGSKTGNVFQRIKGSIFNVNEITENIIRNTNLVYSSALRNAAKLQVFDAIESLGEGGAAIATKLKNTPEIALAADARVLASLKKLGAEVGNKKMEDGLLAVFTPHKPMGPGIEKVIRKGKAEYWQITPEHQALYDALQAYTPQSFVWWMKMFNGASNVLRKGVTLTADFAMVNLVRDSQTAFAQSEAMQIPIWSQMRGLHSRITQNENYWLMLANGGGFATLGKSEVMIAEDMQTFMGVNGLGRHKLINTPRKAAEMAEEVFSALEMATRLEENRLVTAQRAGQPGVLRDAALAASQVSTDFGMRGESTQGIAMSYPFLNARAQGISQGVRSAKRDPVVFAAKVMASVTAPTMYVLHQNWDNPHYWALPDYVRDLNLAIPIPGSGGENFFLIPKGFELGAVFGSIPEQLVDSVKQRSGERFAKGFVRILADQLSMNPLPQAVKPPAMVFGANMNFSGGPVVPSSLEDVAGAEQFRPWTSETLVEMARFLSEDTGVEVSPIQAEAIIRGYMGELAMYGLAMSDALVRAFGDSGDPPDIPLDQRPVFKRFLRLQPFRSTQQQADFYAMLGEANMWANTARLMEDRGDEPGVRRRLDGINGKMAEIAPIMRGFSKTLSEINQGMQSIARDKTMDGAEKTRRIQGLSRQQNEFFASWNRQMPEDLLRAQGFRRLPPERAK